MDPSFWWKLALSFAVGSGWVALTTVAAERYGSALGGLIGGLPSTVVVSLLFIGITQTPQIASATTTIMPLAQGINGIFILVYLLAVRRGLLAGLGSALAVWAVVAGSAASLGIQRLWISLFGWGACALGCYLIAGKGMAIPARGQARVRGTPLEVALRALFGGAVIVCAVVMSKLLGPAYGGIFAAFPAAFFSTLAITHRIGGAEFSRAVGKAMMLTAMFNVPLYVVVVRYLYLWCDLATGTALALMIASVTGYVTYLVMRRNEPSAASDQRLAGVEEEGVRRMD